jgi:hypothetical protein
METTGERRNHPSASGMERIALCPGSFLLEQEAVRQAGGNSNSNEFAEFGTRVAECVERHYTGQARPIQTPEVLAAAQRMIAHTTIVYAAAVNAFGARGITLPPSIGTVAGIRVEARMWSAGNRYSGRADLILYDKMGKWAIIVDHKSGWLPVTVAADNWQLRTLAVLFRTRTGINDILVAIVQPNQGTPTMAGFDKETLDLAERSIDNIVTAAMISGADLNPSPKACRYCSGIGLCSEAYKLFMSVATGRIAKDDFGVALDACEVAEMVIADIKNSAKKALEENPKAIPGWKLTPGAIRNVVENAAMAFARVKDLVDAKTFTGCCSVKFGELVRAFSSAAKLGVVDGKTALKGRLGELVEEKQNRPSLARAEVKDSGGDDE